MKQQLQQQICRILWIFTLLLERHLSHGSNISIFSLFSNQKKKGEVQSDTLGRCWQPFWCREEVWRVTFSHGSSQEVPGGVTRPQPCSCCSAGQGLLMVGQFSLSLWLSRKRLLWGERASEWPGMCSQTLWTLKYLRQAKSTQIPSDRFPEYLGISMQTLLLEAFRLRWSRGVNMVIWHRYSSVINKVCIGISVTVWFTVRKKC